MKKPLIKKQGRQALVDLPEDDPDLIGRGVAIASHFNMYDFNASLKVNKHIFQNGQWELFPTPKNGSCLFASIKRGIAAPEEYRNNHLRYQLVYFLCQHADFMVNVLDLHLSANYGMDRLSKEDFKKAEEEGTLTKEQREAQTLLGPFSYVEYLENLLNESFWGDHGVLLSLSMMWQVTITSFTAETYEEHRVRHKRRLPYPDLLVVWCGESHYLGTCKCFAFLLSCYERAAMVWRWCGEWRDCTANGVTYLLSYNFCLILLKSLLEHFPFVFQARCLLLWVMMVQ